MTELRDWIGRSETRVDRLDAGRCNALLTALGATGGLVDGDPLPLLGHWLHFWDARTPAETGEDGHPHKGGFLPPVPLPRRMWAGGRLTFASPLRLGAIVERRSTIATIVEKSGRSGTLVFVTVLHELSGGDGPAIREEQDLVYRDQAPAAPAMLQPHALEGESDILPDEVLLFRYSALTFNSHRIHYDRAYARGVEAYPDLVVQGPLQATILAHEARKQLGDIGAFAFRGVAPAFVGRPLRIAVSPANGGIDLTVTQDARPTMQATARPL
ncbi:FAS1-like dehydratase domain-containing protein [Sphingomonas profundi]|uniref:FAS1-like dehydratase domain-containing protein n=1 Tax=Alterirhizorhabdus profundi TaxID=2681549 RepID=UPI0012E801F2|nr:MaoC family dehydratase N-terminal domain-containing protein [Sphingomonas profundi]